MHLVSACSDVRLADIEHADLAGLPKKTFRGPRSAPKVGPRDRTLLPYEETQWTEATDTAGSGARQPGRLEHSNRSLRLSGDCRCHHRAGRELSGKDNGCSFHGRSLSCIANVAPRVLHRAPNSRKFAVGRLRCCQHSLAPFQSSIPPSNPFLPPAKPASRPPTLHWQDRLCT